MLPKDSPNALVVGSGGREHAIAWKLLRSKHPGQIYVAPGNGGTSEHNVPIKVTDVDGLIKFAREHNCFTVVGPEAPLAAGIVDRFREEGLPMFGPTKQQAMLESSKVYAKQVMKKRSVPSANFEVFTDAEKALDYSERRNGNVVVKADGLAAGKGVFVCSSVEESRAAINSILKERVFGESGNVLVIEDKLVGREISLITLCNGRKAVPFGTATDHKRLLDGDKGPNTGGMGAYSPAKDFESGDVEDVMDHIVRPVVSETGFCGFLYAGLMLTEKGPMVLEFNARLGDPETQVILPRLNSDFFELLQSYALAEEAPQPEWSNVHSTCVVMCSRGYPSDPKTGDEVIGLERTVDRKDTIIFHAGTKRVDGRYYTNGGRVLCVTGLGNTLSESTARAYEAVSSISWNGECHRSDIASAKVRK